MRNHRVEVAALEGICTQLEDKLMKTGVELMIWKDVKTLLQSEPKELMAERRTLMRELGDLDARKAHSEGELREILMMLKI